MILIYDYFYKVIFNMILIYNYFYKFIFIFQCVHNINVFTNIVSKHRQFIKELFPKVFSSKRLLIIIAASC